MILKTHTQFMRKGAYALFCFFVSWCSFAQVNLVPNPSFEDSITIPQTHSELNKTQNWFVVAGSPDYFSIYSPTSVPFPGASVNLPNNCMGRQFARTKNYCTGLFLRVNGLGTVPPYLMGRECMEVQLIQPLLANHSYSFTMYYSLAEASQITTNQLTAYFSVNQFTLGTNLYDTTSYHNYLSTQINHDSSFINDTANWIPLTGCFIANGGEEYLTIGNFKNALHTPTLTTSTNFTPCPAWGAANACYIYIDDVSLYDMGLYLPAACKNDTLICNGTNLALANNIKDSSIVAWNPQTALTCTNCPNPVASPTTTTLYYLNKSICGASSKDSILVQVHTPTATANAGPDKNLCPNDIIQLGISDSTNFTNYSWQFIGNSVLSCTNCAMPLASVQETTEFILQRTECNVTTSDTVNVIVDLCDLIIPTVFTPNNDDINDVWKFKLPTGAKLNELNIYNRWGILVYSTNSNTLPLKSDQATLVLQWDGYTAAGVACNEGVYFYTLNYTDKKGEVQNLKGFVSLFR